MEPCNEYLVDIEDLVSSDDPTPNERYYNKSNVNIHLNKNDYITDEDKTEREDVVNPMSNIPATQTIFIKTWGCSHNISDSEYIAGLLVSGGYKLTKNRLVADLWVLNSCTVKTPSEDYFRNMIKEAKKLKKHVVLAGCIPQGSPNIKYISGLSVVGVQQIDSIINVVEETLKGNTVKYVSLKKELGKKLGGTSLTLPKIRRNPLIEIIPINTGCLNTCTYCKTKHARGKLASYPPEEILARMQQVFEEGVVEVWLTSEDTGAYGIDIGTSLPELLWMLVEYIPDGCMLRLGMTNPPYILQHLDEIAKILNHPRVYSFLHVPVQSGSDYILQKMKREYNCEDFETVVKFVKEKIPGITIATDIICGFPGETNADFEETFSLVEKYKFPTLFVNQFYSRPGTPAALMEKVPENEAKKRTKILTDYFRSYYPYDNNVGRICDILVTEIAKKTEHFVGHNKYYEQVLIPPKKEYMGKFVKVIITETKKFCMIGNPISIIEFKTVKNGIKKTCSKQSSNEIYQKHRIIYSNQPLEPAYFEKLIRESSLEANLEEEPVCIFLQSEPTYQQPNEEQRVPESTDQRVPESTDQPVPESTDQPVPESTDQPVPESTDQPVPESTDQPNPESEQSIQQLAEQSVQSTKQPRLDESSVEQISVDQIFEKTDLKNSINYIIVIACIVVGVLISLWYQI